MRRILIATSNPGKFREIIAVLGENAEPATSGDAAASEPRPARRNDPPLEWLSQADLPAPPVEPHEDGATFAENAALKAVYYSKASKLWTLADDSGLEVDALGGAPGVRSARYADLPPTAPRDVADRANNARLIAALQGVPAEKRTARFRCALALADGGRILATAEGVVEGLIIDEPRGRGGFGYDPHFLVSSLGRTTAELAPEDKNRISHRGQALRTMREAVRTLLRDQAANLSPAGG